MSCGRAKKAGPRVAGSSITASACGSDCTICSGRLIRSQYRVTGLNASVTVIVGFSNTSTCWSTGSTIRCWNVSPENSRTGIRLAWATAAAVTMFVQPGPIDDVAIMIRRPRIALPYATAARAMDCSLWPRHVGNWSWTGCSASARQVTLPWPKIPKAPAKTGTSSPSTTVCCVQQPPHDRPAQWSVGSSPWLAPHVIEIRLHTLFHESFWARREVASPLARSHRSATSAVPAKMPSVLSERTTASATRSIAATTSG